MIKKDIATLMSVLLLSIIIKKSMLLFMQFIKNILV